MDAEYACVAVEQPQTRTHWLSHELELTLDCFEEIGCEVVVALVLFKELHCSSYSRISELIGGYTGNSSDLLLGSADDLAETECPFLERGL